MLASRDNYGSAYYCLTAAAALRQQSEIPHKGDEAADCAALHDRIAKTLTEAEMKAIQTDASDDSLEAIVDRALKSEEQ